jgi:hypothetical protein
MMSVRTLYDIPKRMHDYTCNLNAASRGGLPFVKRTNHAALKCSRAILCRFVRSSNEIDCPVQHMRFPEDAARA